MSKVFQVPAPADDHQTITDAAQSLSRAVGTFDDHRATLVSLAGDASQHWEGSAFATFAAAHAGGTAFIDRIATAHQAHAQAHACYGSKVADAQNAARSCQTAIKSHLESYKSKSHGHMQALHEDINRHLNEAQAKLLKAEHELLSNPVAAAADALSGFGDLAGAGLDSLVGELTSALGHVSSWQPPDIEPQLASMRPGVDQLVLLSGQAVLDELAAIGDFLASQVLEGIADVLDMLGLGAAAKLVRDTEQQFAEAAAAEHRKATQAFHDLEAAASKLASQIEQVVTQVLSETWHAVQQVANEVVDGIEDAGEWVWKNRKELLGDVALAASIVSLVPGFDLIAFPVALVATGLMAIDDGVQGHWQDLVWDGIELATLGGGAIFADGVKAVKGAKAFVEEGGGAIKGAKVMEAQASKLEEEAGGALFRSGENDVEKVSNAEEASLLRKDAANIRNHQRRSIFEEKVKERLHPLKTIQSFQEIGRGTGNIALFKGAATNALEGANKVPFLINDGIGLGESVVDTWDKLVPEKDMKLVPKIVSSVLPMVPTG